MTGEAFFRSLTRHLAQAFDAEVAFVAELLGEDQDRARILAVKHDGSDLYEGLEFALKNAPCELILETDVVSIPESTTARFPMDKFTVRHGLEGYLAVVMRGTDGERIGYIGVQSTRRLEADADERAALAIFGARAGAEIERRRHEAMLSAREAEIAGSRVRIVEAADEERRRIGRNLHDGAQQRLVALGHLLAMAERKLSDEPGRRRRRCSSRRATRPGWPATSCASWCAAFTPRASSSTGWATRSRRSPRARRCPCTSTRCPSAACPPRSRRRSTTSSPRRSPTRSSTRAPRRCASRCACTASACWPR